LFRLCHPTISAIGAGAFGDLPQPGFVIAAEVITGMLTTGKVRFYSIFVLAAAQIPLRLDAGHTRLPSAGLDEVGFDNPQTHTHDIYHFAGAVRFKNSAIDHG
jgi:hypothetical protein